MRGKKGGREEEKKGGGQRERGEKSQILISFQERIEA